MAQRAACGCSACTTSPSGGCALTFSDHHFPSPSGFDSIVTFIHRLQAKHRKMNQEKKAYVPTAFFISLFLSEWLSIT